MGHIMIFLILVVMIVFRRDLGEISLVALLLLLSQVHL